jgi:hypothetical protein
VAQAHENDLEAAVADYQSQLEEDDPAQLEAEEEADEGQSQVADTVEGRATEESSETQQALDEDHVGSAAPSPAVCALPVTSFDRGVGRQSLVLTLQQPRPGATAMETAAALDGFAGFGGPTEPTEGDETFKQVDEVAQRLGMEVRAPLPG